MFHIYRNLYARADQTFQSKKGFNPHISIRHLILPLLTIAIFFRVRQIYYISRVISRDVIHTRHG